jgi:hypothetical protein
LRREAIILSKGALNALPNKNLVMKISDKTSHAQDGKTTLIFLALVVALAAVLFASQHFKNAATETPTAPALASPLASPIASPRASPSATQPPPAAGKFEEKLEYNFSGNRVAYYHHVRVAGGEYFDEAIIENDGSSAVKLAVVEMVPPQLSLREYSFKQRGDAVARTKTLSLGPLTRAALLTLEPSQSWASDFEAALSAPIQSVAGNQEVFFEEETRDETQSGSEPPAVERAVVEGDFDFAQVNLAFEECKSGSTQVAVNCIKQMLEPTKKFSADAWPAEVVFTVSENTRSLLQTYPVPEEAVMVFFGKMTGDAAKFVSVRRDEINGKRFIFFEGVVDADYENRQLDFDEADGEVSVMALGFKPAKIKVKIIVEHEATSSKLDAVRKESPCVSAKNINQPKLIAFDEASKLSDDELEKKCLSEGIELVRYAKSFCGKKYDLACPNPPQTFSCACFVSYVLQKARLEGMPYYVLVQKMVDWIQQKALARKALKVKANKLLPGDLLFFKTYLGIASYENTHVEFYAGNELTLGASEPQVRLLDFWPLFSASYECNRQEHPKECGTQKEKQWEGKRVFRGAYRVIPSCVEYTRRLQAQEARGD